jgi:hypothetical protein
MVYRFFKHKWQKVALICLVSLIAIVLILALVINHYWSPILAKKLKSTVAEASDGLYKIDFSTAELKILQGRIVVYNITLKPDTAVYRQKLKQHLAPNNLYELKVNRLVLKHIHPFKLYFSKRLDIGQIVLSAPELRATYLLNHKKDTTEKDKRTLYQKIKKSLKSIHVGEIQLNDVKLKYEDYSGSKIAVSELKELHLMAKELLIDSTTQTDTSRFFYCKDVITDINNFTWQTKDKLYTFKVKHFSLSTATSKLKAEHITIDPSKDFFAKKPTDRFTIRMASAQLSNFDYNNYNKYRNVSASALTISNGSVTIANSAQPSKNKKTDKASTFPQVSLSKVATDFKLDTLNIRNVDVRYNEFNQKTKRWGDVHFTAVTGHMLNLTNNKAALQKNNIAAINLQSYFMGSGKLNVKFTFNLTDKSLPYTYSGALGPMGMQPINQATVPLATVRLTSGKINSLKFDIKGNKDKANGRVSLLYNDLKIKLLRVNENKELKGKGLISLMANTFVIKRNNPDNPGEVPRSFNVTYLRPYDSPFFKTVWKTLLAGLKPCAGYDKTTETEMTVKLNERDKEKRDKELKKKREEMKEKQKEKKEKEEKQRKKDKEKNS